MESLKLLGFAVGDYLDLMLIMTCLPYHWGYANERSIVAFPY
jgi:hypothetical protein